MDRKIKMADVKEAVSDAYNKYKNLNEGSADLRVAGNNDGKFGLSVRLIDGRKVDVGDTQAQFPLGAISRIPVLIQLLTQMKPEDLVKKMGINKGCCCHAPATPKENHKHTHAKGVRAVSMIEPIGDYDGKMEILSDLMTELMGASPILEDKVYQAAQKAIKENDVINVLAADGFEIYDASEIAVDLYARLRSLLVTTEKLAEMGATIAADGLNPDTKKPVFDGTLSATICAMIAAKGPKKMGKPWLMLTGTPAMCCYAGGFIAIVPGFGSIAGFSPELNEAKVPVKAAKAIKNMLNQLQLNAFSSARVDVVE